MIIVRAPFRVSLFGGGSDYPNFIKENGRGLCIGFAINQYSYIHARPLPPYFPYKTRLAYSEIETVKDNRHIKHKAIRTALEFSDLLDSPLEISHISDLPSKVGLGTSSSFLVALISALHSSNDNLKIAATASTIEQIYSYVGMQDHYFASIGGCRFLHWSGNNLLFSSMPMHWLKDMVEEYGLLFYTGIERNASDIVSTYIKDLPNNEAQKSILRIAETVFDETMDSGISVERIGHYLDMTWLAKRNVSNNITNYLINRVYEEFQKIGIYGGKLCGAGAGGSFFILAPKEKHRQLINFARDQKMLHIPFKVDTLGCQRIL